MSTEMMYNKTTSPRQTNMELLRLLAMLLILVGHALFFNYPDSQQIKDAPVLSISRFLYSGLSVCSVDVFVLISGWFGIRYKEERLLSLVFQTLFFTVLVYTTLAIWKPLHYLNLDALSTIILFHSDDLWFIKAYIGMYLIAPMLNKYIETATERQLRNFLIVFYSFQTIYGWLNLYGAHWFEGGFSMVSFLGLYILARYVRLHLSVQKGKYIFLYVYLIIGFGLGLIAFMLAAFDIKIYGRLLTYTDPLVIIEGVCLVIFFSKLNIQCKFINYVAASCLAIYLLHANELVLRPYYFGQIKQWANENTIMQTFTYSILWISSFAAASILLDQIRKMIWKSLENLFLKKVR